MVQDSGPLTSNMRCMNSSLDKKEGFQSSLISWAWACTAVSEKIKYSCLQFMALWKEYMVYHLSWNLGIPWYVFRYAIVDFRTVDLSIFLLEVDTIEHSSFTNILNWSLRFFSLRFRLTLQTKTFLGQYTCSSSY